MASKNHLKQRLDPHKQEKYLGTERSPSPLLYVLAGVALLTGLFALSRTHYLLFHNLTELFSIAVAWSVFLLVWNTRRMASNDALLFLGIAYFFIGFMDLLHTLAYKGMGVFAQAQASNLAAQLWVTARGMEAISLLLFTILLGRRLWRWCTVAGFTALTVISLGSIFMWEAFPNCYIEGQGLTAIKTGAEYAICLVLVIAMTRLYGRREQLDANMLRLMIGAMALTIAAEMAFTLYSDVYGLSNAAGHFLKVISFSLVYQALVRSTVTRPHTTIFRELGQAKEKLVQEGRQLHLLQQISDLFLESRTLDGTLQELPKTIAAYFKTPIVAVELYEAGEQEMVFVGSIGIAATEENTKLRVPVDQTISGTVARTGQAVIYLNVGTHDDCSIQTLKDLNAVTFVCVPMTGQKGIIGTLTIADRRERPDIVDAAALIQILANNLAQEIRRRQQERRFLRLYHTMTQGVVIQDAQGKIIEANSAAGEILGLSPDQMLGRTACDPCWGLIQEDGSPYDPAQMPFDIALRTGKPVKDVLCGINVPKDHEHRWFVISSAPYFNRGEAKPSSAMTVFTDITERKHAESEHEATIQMLEILNAKTDLRELMNALLHFMRELSGCNAVGIRLKDGEDYLYYETSGFSNEFVAAETHLCVQDLDGQLVRDEMGNPVLECMCGNILCSRFDPTLPFFTDFGSFISNGTTELLANTSEEDRQARTRNRCNAEGYESVLLVPLRAGGETFGLLQFNDYRTGCFLPHFVGQAERMAGDVAIALAQRKAEKMLRKSQALLMSVFSTTPGFLALKDRKSVYLMANEAFCVFLGKSQQEILGKTDYDLFPSDEAQAYQKGDIEVMTTGNSERGDWDVTGASGNKQWVHVIKTPVFDQSGRVTGVLCSVTDITVRKRAEEALKTQKNFSESIVRCMPGLFYVFDETSDRFSRRNGNWEQVTGYTTDELNEMTALDCVADRDLCASRMQAAYDRGWSSMDNALLTKSGQQIPYHFTGTKLVMDGKAFLVGMGLDISERVRAEQALEKRLVALTRPLDDPGEIIFEDLFNLPDIQRLQDQFAEATGVASIITHTDGTPITQPSNFCRLCSEIIRQTDKGLQNCRMSDALLGQYNPDGPVIQPCLSSGLWDAGAAISVGGRHIANWVIGQVCDEAQTDEQMRAYAREIGADEAAVIEAFHEVPAMPREQFEAVSQALFTLASQLSDSAYQNVQQARFITEHEQAQKRIIVKQAQLKSLASELVLAEEQERQRLAVHLHDDVCQNLAYAKMRLQMVNAALGDETHIADMTEVSDTLTRMMQEVRSLTFELSTPMLTEFGLETAISHWLDEQIEQKHGIGANFTDDGQAKPLKEDVQALLFRSVRELLVNVVKHSRAQQVAVQISRQEDRIIIQLEDDGVGFSPEEVVIGEDTGGFGLFSIRERLSYLGGSLEIDSSPGAGCRSILRAPLENQS